VSVRLVELDAPQLAQRVDDVLDVYAEAMEVPASTARSRRSIIAAHLQRRGLRAILALEDERVLGVAYGYHGQAGQWWHDQVHEALMPEQAEQWLEGAFEVCELHVRPSHQGTGLGRDLLAALLHDLPVRTAVLTTPDAETRARRFYRAGGWVDLRRDLRFPGDPRTFAVLGLRLGSDA
jgi:GNAT superfamily N-acetyltransferase